MKKSFLLSAILALMAINLLAQDVPSADNAILDKFIQSRFTMKKVLINSDTLKRVLAGSVYSIRADYADSSSSAVLWESRVIISNGKLFVPEELSTTKKLTGLFRLVRKDFFLRTETDVKFFERMLDIIYPLGWSNEKYREHLKKDGKWYFVRGEFFENKEAVIVTMDASQKITAISFSLEALKK